MTPRPELESRLRGAVVEAAFLVRQHRMADPERETQARAVLGDYLQEQGMLDDSLWFDRDIAAEVMSLYRAKAAGEEGQSWLCIFRDCEIGYPNLGRGPVHPTRVWRHLVKTARGREPAGRPRSSEEPALLHPLEYAAPIHVDWRRHRGYIGAHSEPRVFVWVLAEVLAPRPLVAHVAEVAIQIDAERRGLL